MRETLGRRLGAAPWRSSGHVALYWQCNGRVDFTRRRALELLHDGLGCARVHHLDGGAHGQQLLQGVEQLGQTAVAPVRLQDDLCESLQREGRALERLQQLRDAGAPTLAGGVSVHRVERQLQLGQQQDLEVRPGVARDAGLPHLQQNLVQRRRDARDAASGEVCEK